MASGEARRLIEEALREGRGRLLEHEALRLLELYGVPVPRYALARSREEAVEAARGIGGRVVLKVVSPEIVHKSDVGGVVVGVEPERVGEEYEVLLERVRRAAPGARIVGVLVQEMAPPGAVEVVVGGVRDPVFGPAVMFGLGGVFVELFRDVSFRVAPFPRGEALEMMREVRAYRLLQGYRGKPPRDLEALADIVMAAQRIMMDNPEISEMDINPVMSYPKGALAVDARFILKPPEG
ncbi:MAG: acetyl-CoA synthetase [Crenarchaeota archaeon]|nr:acetyl-CoA synthetase [Thermoproteota archaeon]